MSKRPFLRAAVTAALLTVSGLAAFTQSATADPAPIQCAGTLDGSTYTLTEDCSVTEQIDVPDGWTIDGAGHTITAEDNGDTAFSGAVLASAVGTGDGVATMNVENLRIDGQFGPGYSGDNLYGIYLHRANGSITNVSVNGITHGKGAQEGRAVMVDNRTDTGTLATPRADVTLDGVTVTNYQKAGVQLEGNLAFTATQLDVGMAGTPDGDPLTAIAANSVEILYGAHGSLTDSTIAENNFAATGDEQNADATAVLLYNSGAVTLARNVITGTDGDVGIDIYNGRDDATTTAKISCSTFRRIDGGNADPTFGFAISSEAGAVDVTVASNTFSGWRKNIKDDTEDTVTRTSDPSCTTVATMTAAPRVVTWHGATTVTAHVATGAGANVAGAAVTLRAQPVGSAGFTTVATGTTSANGTVSLTDRPARNTRYRVLVAKDTYTGSTSNTVLVLVRPKITVARSAASVRPGHSVTFSGTVGPDRPGHSVELQRKQGQQWIGVRSARLDSNSAYSVEWHNRTRATYSFRVLELADPNFAQGMSRTISVTVR